MANKPVSCSACGHSASDHRKGRSACRMLIAGGDTGTKADENKPARPGAVKRIWGTHFSGWECGCKMTPEQIRTERLGEQCEHCNGTGRKS